MLMQWSSGSSKNYDCDSGGTVELEGVGVTQPYSGAYQFRLKFGKQAYYVAELQRGEGAAAVAKKLRELAAQVEAHSK